MDHASSLPNALGCLRRVQFFELKEYAQMKASYFNNTPCTLREEGRMKASCFVNASYSLRKGFKLHDYAMHSKGEMALFFRSALHCFDVRFIVLKYTLLFQISICCFKGHFLVPKCA